MQFHIHDKTVSTDLPFGELTISGNEAYGFRPFQLLVSSIASCSGMVFRTILEKQRVELEELIIETKVERNAEEAHKIEKIMLHFIVKGKNLNEQKLLRNLGVARRNCAMIRSVEDSITIEETLELN